MSILVRQPWIDGVSSGLFYVGILGKILFCFGSSNAVTSFLAISTINFPSKKVEKFFSKYFGRQY